MMEYDMKPIEVQIAWKHSEGFWLWASDDAGIPLAADELRRILFGRHRRTFFGTMLDSKASSSYEALLLDPWAAIDYWQKPAVLRYATVEFGELGEVLRKAAGWIQRIVSEGWFIPELSVWSEGAWCWSAAVPVAHKAAYQATLQQANDAGFTQMEQWLHDAVTACIDQVPEAAEAWSRIVDAYPALRTESLTSAIMTEGEEEWLEDIGLSSEPKPFTASLQLAEPDHEQGDEGWRLQFRLKDRATGEWTAIVGTDSELLDGTPPQSWLAQIPDVLDNWTEKALKLVQALADPERPQQLKNTLSEEEAVQFLTAHSLELAQAGLSIWLPGWWGQAKRSTPRLKAKLQAGAGSSPTESLFGLKQVSAFQVRLALGGKEYTDEEMETLLQAKRQLVKLHGQWVYLDPAVMARLRKRLKRLERQGLSSHELLQAAFMRSSGGSYESDGMNGMDDSLDADAELLDIDLDAALKSASEVLQRKEGYPIIAIPDTFRGELRPYQRQGASWLAYLFDYGLGGCLADDMGLGKTVQWIVYILHLKELGKLSGPSLLICPTSVLGNWQKELERFAPSLRVQLHHGADRARGSELASMLDVTDLFLTSYSLANMDREEFCSVDWCCLCLDEAQNVKNVYTKQAQAIRTFHARHRVALTGTPIENRLTELWSIIDFLNPHYLGSNRQFTKKVVQPLEKTNDAELINQVQRWVQPFLLRRVKKEPAIQLDLPDKQEFKTYVTLTAEQAALYESVLDKLFESIEKLPPMERRGTVLAALTRLKQVCGHPALLLKESPQHVRADRSQKLIRLLEMVQEVRDEGERCLIFTQFVEMGTILQSVLQKQFKEDVLFLYGGVPKQDRDTMIERFQDGQSDSPNLFVLSLKAGGTGLNLTGANHVFHYDRWWNPAVENQATDRAYRIGQTREVQVHKMIALGTLEERIDEMIDRKQEWSRRIVGSGDSWVSELSDDELKKLFELRQPLLS